jgi:hypothetical protein
LFISQCNSRFPQQPNYIKHPFIQELRSLAKLPVLDGIKSRKAVSIAKSAIGVLRGQTQTSVHRTGRVPNPSGSQKFDHAVTQMWMNATAPAHAITQVQVMSLLLEVATFIAEEGEVLLKLLQAIDEATATWTCNMRGRTKAQIIASLQF